MRRSPTQETAVKTIITTLDPLTREGQPIVTKGGETLVSRFALEMETPYGILTLDGAALWHKGGKFRLEFPGEGYGRKPLSDSRYVTAMADDGEFFALRPGNGKALAALLADVLDKYAEARKAA